MDNLCHTLVGAALGEAGLKKRTALGMLTLMVGANLPDVDVVAVPLGHSLEWRRGWTHGVPALFVLPVLLAVAVVAWDRWVRRRGGRVPDQPVRPRQVLLLAALSVWTHPLLDWMNTYGMRWLMPLRDRWYYGDSIFIVDPWMWLALGAGALLSRRLWRRGAARAGRPARAALALTAVYVAAMVAATQAGRRIVREEARARGVAPGGDLMVGPVPVNPFRREVVLEDGARYRLGSLHWLPAPTVRLDAAVEKNADHPAARAAAAREEARAFLHWARFPFFVVREGPAGTVVHVVDARYTRDPGARFGALAVPLPAAGSGPP